ncbi:MAG: hypothetical protein R3240_11815 [Gammaproteobacteria bacterium]|nr:hypothetical protein [Gammaproteobacteria bacterium]
MQNIECPNCGKSTITPGDKFKAGKWKDIYCSNCNQRLCANPIVMALLYFALVWDVFFFGFMAYVEKSWIYLSVGLALWAILEFFIYYIPLSKLKAKSSSSDNG